MRTTGRDTRIARGRPRKVGNTRTATTYVCLTHANGSGRGVGRCVRAAFKCGLDEAYSRVEPACCFGRDYRNAIPRSVVTFLRDASCRDTVQLAVSLNNSTSAVKTVANKVTRTCCGRVPRCVERRMLGELPGRFVSVVREFCRVFMSGEVVGGDV